MHVILLSLPWADARYPSAALGALTAYLELHRPDWEVACEHPCLELLSWDRTAYVAISQMDFEGELVYASLLYPELEGSVERLAAYWQSLPETNLLGRYLHANGKTALQFLSELRPRLDAHIDRIVASRSWDDAVVGLTNSGSQLFANLLFAKRLKQACPGVTIVLGGPTVSAPTIGDSVLATYPFVDFIVHGEGERPLLALIDQIEAYGPGATVESSALPKGVGSRRRPVAEAGQWQIENLDELPAPNHDSFYFNTPYLPKASVPIEASRGCWWVRSDRHTCQFCNLNIQWAGYRQKSAQRISQELSELARRYNLHRFTFVDNILRVRGFDELVDELAAIPIDLSFFYEARAHITPEMILRLVEAGMRGVQFGLEGLSTTFLRRINKGTTAIMNLQVMKICAELKVNSVSNLIVDFPGATRQEVDETVSVIERFAFAYQPALVAGFELGIDSTVQRYPEEFGLTELRNHERYAQVIPPEVLATLKTYQLSWSNTPEASVTDWQPVKARVNDWVRWCRTNQVRFDYLDGGTFLNIIRQRPNAALETIRLPEDEAKVYRFCLRTRLRSEIHRRLASESLSIEKIDATLAGLAARDLIFQEGNHFLSLAKAPDPYIAMRRIRREAAEDRAARGSSARLAVVSG